MDELLRSLDGLDDWDDWMVGGLDDWDDLDEWMNRMIRMGG